MHFKLDRALLTREQSWDFGNIGTATEFADSTPKASENKRMN